MRRIRRGLAATAIVVTMAVPLADAAGAHGGDNREFPDPTNIDNRFFPVVPGTQLTYEGRAGDGGLLDHRVVFTVTDLVKVINGVPSVVIWDQDISEGELIESELAFWAQDRDGNVWNFGEYPEEFEEGAFVGAPNTWIDGLEGAQRGILVPGNPQVGSPEFVQGSSPEIDFLDVGKVAQTDASTCVPFGCFNHVLVIDESSPLEPEAGHQLKYYAPGVGNVRIEPVGGEDPETLVLIDAVQLDKRALAQARLAAWRLDVRAYVVSELYRDTRPATLDLQPRGKFFGRELARWWGHFFQWRENGWGWFT